MTGGLASIVNIGVYWVLAARGMDPNLAWTAGFIAAVLVGYVVHSRWSFRGHGADAKDTSWKFFLVSLFSYGANTFWVWLLTDDDVLAGPWWWPLIPILFVTPFATFLLNRLWVFK